MALLPYIIKLSISLAVVFAFYHFLLRRLTFHNSNRWYLLLYSVVSFLIPFINISPFLSKSELESANIVKYFPTVSPYTFVVEKNDDSFQYFSLLNLALVLIAIGILVMMVRLVIQYLSFLKVKRSANLIHKGEMSIYQVDKSIIPFSIGNSIFINQNLHEEEELKEIIRHEFIHIREKHSIDILWGEFLCMLNWYNPFAWMIRKSIRQNLEFIADKKVLESGLDKKQYQYMLLKVIGVTQFSIANQFNFSSLKKRIAMMNKNRSAKGQILKFLLLLPLLAVVLLAFRQVATSQSMNFDLFTESKVQITDTVPPKPPAPPKPQKYSPPKLVLWIDSTATQITVEFKDGTQKKYDLNNPKEKAEFRQKYKQIDLPHKPPPPPQPPKKSDDMVIDASEHITITADSFVFRDKLSVDEVGDLKWKVRKEIVAEPLYFLNGKRIDEVQVKKVITSDIKHIEIMKDENAVAVFGPDAVHGVINIVTKDAVNNKVNLILDSIRLKNFIPADKANVLYIGIDNPISIEVEGVTKENIVIEATGSTYVEKKGGKWIIKVGNIEENIEIKIFEKKPDGKLKYINSRYFRSRLLPDPKKAADNI